MAQPVPVLRLIHTVAYGGVETAVLNWLQAMDPSRFEIHLACFANPGETEAPFVAAARQRGFTVDFISWNRRKPILKAARQLTKVLRQYDIRILHTHNTYADIVGAAASHLRKVKTISTVYVWSKFHWQRNLLQLINRWVLHDFDVISAHCEDTYERTLNFGFNPSRVKLLTCGYECEQISLPVEERRQRRAELGAGDEHVVLANVARLYPEKAQDELLLIFQRIHKIHPETRLWIAGVGPLEENLKAQCSALGLDDCVRFVGFVKELASFLQLVDIHVNSSSSEGVPLAICSGLAAGLPIVATAVGGLPEILNHGRAGILVPYGQYDAFVTAASHLVKNPAERKRVGKAGRNFIESEYSLKSAVARVEQTYDQMLQGSF